MAKVQVKVTSRVVKTEFTVRWVENKGVVGFERTEQVVNMKSKPFIHRGYADASKVKSYTAHGIKKACLSDYVYFSKQDFKRFQKALATGSEDFFRVWNKVLDKSDPVSVVSKRSFDPRNLLRGDWGSHLFYRFGDDLPVSRPYRIDYIGGVTNEHFNLSVAREILEKNPWVTNVMDFDIPYYNASSECNRAVEFVVMLPQEKHDEIARMCEKNRLGLWKIKNEIVYNHWDKGDVLGLKMAYIGDKNDH